MTKKTKVNKDDKYGFMFALATAAIFAAILGYFIHRYYFAPLPKTYIEIHEDWES